MKLFAIGDLHLAGNSDKPMDVFGSHWDNHFQKIQASWQANVGGDDIVLIPGDISWAMSLSDAMTDLEAIHALPGRKIILRGNHDFWWPSLTKLKDALPSSITPIQNDALVMDDICFAGTRGWVCPESAAFAESERKIYDREVQRLTLSLKKTDATKPLVCMMHFPPFNERRQSSGFTELFRQYKAKTVVYGHLHGKSCKGAFEGSMNGTEYLLCSCDHIGFEPKMITF